MQIRKPDVNTMEWHLTPLLLPMAVLCLGVGLCVLTPDSTTLRVLVAYLVALGIGWIVAATLLTRLTSRGLFVAPPSLPRMIRALSKIQVEILLYNAKRRMPHLFLSVELSLRSGDMDLGAAPRFLPILLPRHETSFSWTVTVRQRAPLTIDTIEISTTFPGSLLTVRSAFVEEKVVRVIPAAYELREQVEQILIGRRSGTGRSQLLPVAMEEFAGTRDYRPGDNPRLIHMALSLRTPDFPYQLVVREFEDPTKDDISLILDTALPTDDVDMERCLHRFEKGIAFASALSRVLVEKGYSLHFLTLCANQGRVDLRLGSREMHLHSLESTLGLLAPVTERAEIWSMLDNASRRASGAVLFVSLREIAEERLNPRLSVLTLTPDTVEALTEEVVSV